MAANSKQDVSMTDECPWRRQSQKMHILYQISRSQSKLHFYDLGFSWICFICWVWWQIWSIYLLRKIPKNGCTVRDCCANNRVLQWTFMDPWKPKVRPESRDKSSSPDWRAAPSMNTHTADTFLINKLNQNHY